MSKLYFFVFLAILSVSLGCAVHGNDKSPATKAEVKPQDDIKAAVGEKSARVVRHDTPPDVKSEKSDKDGEKQHAEKEAEEKLNKKVSDEITDEIVKIADHHTISDHVQPAKDAVNKARSKIIHLQG